MRRMPPLCCALALSLASRAEAGTWSPVRVHVECQRGGRSDTCQAVSTLLEEEEVVALVPRSEAQVVLYVHATEQANDDSVLLRAVGELPGAPAEFEQIAVLDSRASVDARRGALEAPLRRALSPYVLALYPGAVSVEYTTPADLVLDPAPTRPWGVSMWVGGWGSWTEDYQDLSIWDGVSLYYVTNDARGRFSVWHDRSINRQPDLEIDGQSVSLSSDAQSVAGALSGAKNLNDAWTIGFISRGGHDDPEGQFLGTVKGHVGVERNWFPSDDPRGNRLAAAWLIGVQADWYNQINSIGETSAFFPTQIAMLEGTIQRDTIEVNVNVGGGSELFQPLRRYALLGEAGVNWNVGDHLDLGFNVDVTRQAIPGPGEVDETSFEELSRASYAEPLQVSGYFNVRVHFDNTNSAWNNRFQGPMGLDATGNL